MTTHPTTDVDPAELTTVIPKLREGLVAGGFTVAGLSTALGAGGVAALDRGDAATLRRRAARAGSAGALLRLFVLRESMPRGEVAALLPGVDLDAAVRGGLLGDSGERELRTCVDLRPMEIGGRDRWVLSDLDGALTRVDTRPDHVLGVGQASLSLLQITPSSPAGTLLDLGTGCGIQLVHGAPGTSAATGTDITARCLDLAAATLALDEVDAELLSGPWYEPVAGRTFDRIVANPPFVVGPPALGHSYRESGLALDGASRLVVSGAPEHLAPGGTAVVLGSWVHRSGQDWRARLASWLPEHGVDAWVLQRDVADPELYVWTWLTDEGLDARDDDTADEARGWLDHLEAEDVEAVGFGYVFLRAVEGPTTVTCEEFRHPFERGLGDEAMAYFARQEWLRTATDEHGDQAAAVDATVFRIPAGVRMHTSVDISTPDSDGPDRADSPEPAAQLVVVERLDGPRWRHELDEVSASLLRGIGAGALPLEDVMLLAALAAGADPEEFAPAARAVVSDLLRHGIVVPVGVPDLTRAEWTARSAGAPS